MNQVYESYDGAMKESIETQIQKNLSILENHSCMMINYESGFNVQAINGVALKAKK